MPHKSEKLVIIRQFLNSLEQEKVLRLAWSMEENTISHLYEVPSEVILAMLRPKLAVLNPQRFPKMERALCVPFEDLLTSDDPMTKIAGNIARASISPVWKYLAANASPEFAAVQKAFRKAQESNDRETIEDLTPGLWRSAADTLLAILEKTGRKTPAEKVLAKALGGQPRLDDLREMAAVLDIADDIQEMKAALPPKPIRAVDADGMATITGFCQIIAETNPARVPLILAVIFARLQRPRDILRIMTAVAKLELPDGTASESTAILDNMMFGALETTAKEISEATKVDESDVMRLVLRYVDTLTGLTAAADGRKQGKEAMKKRMNASRDKVKAAVVDNVLKTAPTTVLHALPGRASGPPGKDGKLASIEPDLTMEPSDEAFEAAERRAIAVAQCAQFADMLDATAITQKTVGAVSTDLEDYVSKCILRLDNLKPNEAPEAAPHLMFGVRLLELVGGTDRADKLRRKAMTALDKASRS